MGCDCLCSSSHYSPCENYNLELGLEQHPTTLLFKTISAEAIIKILL